MAASDTQNEVKAKDISLRTFIESHPKCKRGSTGYLADWHVLVETEGYNTRTAGMGEAYYDLPDSKAHIEQLCDAYMSAPLEVPPILVQMVNGEPHIRQGHCRLRSLRLAESRGAEIEHIRLDEFKGDGKAQELQTLKGNKFLALSPVATSESYFRLHTEHNMSVKEIALEEHVSEQHVRQILKVRELPHALLENIIRKEVSYYKALDEYADKGLQAVPVIQMAIKMSGKATDKTISEAMIAMQSAIKSTPIETKIDSTEIEAVAALPENQTVSTLSNEPDAGQLKGAEEPPKKLELAKLLPKKITTRVVNSAVPIFQRIIKEAKEVSGSDLKDYKYNVALGYDDFQAITEIMDMMSDHEENQRKKLETAESKGSDANLANAE